MCSASVLFQPASIPAPVGWTDPDLQSGPPVRSENVLPSWLSLRCQINPVCIQTTPSSPGRSLSSIGSDQTLQCQDRPPFDSDSGPKAQLFCLLRPEERTWIEKAG